VSGLQPAGQSGVELVVVQRVFPARHHHRGHGIADEVGQRAAFAHEAVHAENQRHARHRHFRHHRQRGGQGDEARAGHAGRALGAEHRHRQQRDLVAERQSVSVAWAMNSAASVM
jgi:hypothetical protein